MNGILFPIFVCLFQFQQCSKNSTKSKETFSSLINALPVGTQPKTPLLVPINVESPEKTAAAGYLGALLGRRLKRKKIGDSGIKVQKRLWRTTRTPLKYLENKSALGQDLFAVNYLQRP